MPCSSFPATESKLPKHETRQQKLILLEVRIMEYGLQDLLPSTTGSQ